VARRGTQRVLWTLLVFAAACDTRSPMYTHIDLLHELPRAFVQPVSAPRPVVDVVPGDVAGGPAMLTPSPLRLTWSLRFPERVALIGRVAVVGAVPGVPVPGVAVRAGISDGRTYEGLYRLQIDPEPLRSRPVWHPIEVDLSEYSGRKWSLFYQPSRMVWNVILNVDALPGGVAAWQGLSITAK
jgi:hypothetical protein